MAISLIAFSRVLSCERAARRLGTTRKPGRHQVRRHSILRASMSILNFSINLCDESDRFDEAAEARKASGYYVISSEYFIIDLLFPCHVTYRGSI